MKTFLPLQPMLRCKTVLLLIVLLSIGKFAFTQSDLCSGAANLVSYPSCSPTAGAITVSATYTTIPILGCGVNNRNDVWYQFTATASSQTITLNSVSFANPRLQIFSGSCGSLTPHPTGGCGNASVTPTGLTVGAVYFIRVYSSPNATGTFTICLTDPPPPSNDNCATPTSLSPGGSCSPISGTLLYSTVSATPGSCGSASSADVWYSFTAGSAYPSITLSYNAAGHTDFRAASPTLQLFSGTCAGLTQISCMSSTPGTSNIIMSPGGGIIPGNTYYLRVFTKTNTGTILSGNWGFTICVQNPSSSAPTIEFGKSFVNITKGTNGGTIEPGDVLEIRATFAVRSNAAYGCSFQENNPANTTYVPGTLRVLTNEGKLYQQFTDLPDGDAAWTSGVTHIMNIGKGGTISNGGTIRSTDRPSLFNSTCIMVASYRVTVNAVPLGTILYLGGGLVSYRDQPGSAINVASFPVMNALVYKNTGICTNTIGSNGIASGTFGSGTSKDGGASPNVPSNYTYSAFTAGAPGDYLYGVSNNTSAGTTAALFSNNPNEPLSSKRVFSVWDILGDHTNASDPLAGNLPTATSSTNGGYMVVINASYRADTAFKDYITGLCPNTSYEYSAWFRNVCRTCGNDSLGVSPSSVGYIPTGPGDTSGVHPNLTFNINGLDYYTTGDILYTGQWIKKGFTYRTGPSETTMTISIRNNAPGGGGNDWAIDDVGLATCSPNLDVNPSTNTINVCYADGASVSAVVRSFFDNYTYYVWEVSTNNGVTFTPTVYSSAGTVTPVFNGTEYVYNAPGPSFIGDSTTHGNIFRLKVATTASNLNDPNCSFLATRTVQVYVSNCMYLLKTDLLNVSGTLQNNFSRIQWQTLNEADKVSFEIEKSDDGKHFSSIGKVQGNAAALGSGYYSFNDPNALKAAGYYRIKMIEGAEFKYSKVILLSPNKIFFEVKNLVNPFISNLSFDVITPADGDVKVTLHDNFGRLVKSYNEKVFKGISAIKIQNLSGLSSGTYAVRIQWQNEAVIKRVIKLNN